LVCGMKRGIFERDHAVSMFLAKDRHQQSAVGGFDRKVRMMQASLLNTPMNLSHGNGSVLVSVCRVDVAFR